jgi:hypothetical protein
VDVVSVNLSRGDAAILLRLVEGQLEGCACATTSGAVRCDRCEALAAIQGDLGRLLVAPRQARSERAMIGVAAESAASAASIGQDLVWSEADQVVC